MKTKRGDGGSPIKEGFSFGLTSAIITTLGLMIGLAFSTESKLIVIAGIITIAIADAFSDSLGIHLSGESRTKFKTRDIWIATFSTFLSKFFFALTFLIPILLFDLITALLIGTIYGIILLSSLSFYIARKRKENVFKAIFSHLLIASFVILCSYIIGNIIHFYFIN